MQLLLFTKNVPSIIIHHLCFDKCQYNDVILFNLKSIHTNNIEVFVCDFKITVFFQLRLLVIYTVLKHNQTIKYFSLSILKDIVRINLFNGWTDFFETSLKERGVFDISAYSGFTREKTAFTACQYRPDKYEMTRHLSITYDDFCEHIKEHKSQKKIIKVRRQHVIYFFNPIIPTGSVSRCWKNNECLNTSSHANEVADTASILYNYSFSTIYT